MGYFRTLLERSMCCISYFSTHISIDLSISLQLSLSLSHTLSLSLVLSLLFCVFPLELKNIHSFQTRGEISRRHHMTVQKEKEEDSEGVLHVKMWDVEAVRPVSRRGSDIHSWGETWLSIVSIPIKERCHISRTFLDLASMKETIGIFPD